MADATRFCAIALRPHAQLHLGTVSVHAVVSPFRGRLYAVSHRARPCLSTIHRVSISGPVSTARCGHDPFALSASRAYAAKRADSSYSCFLCAAQLANFPHGRAREHNRSGCKCVTVAVLLFLSSFPRTKKSLGLLGAQKYCGACWFLLNADGPLEHVFLLGLNQEEVWR